MTLLYLAWMEEKKLGAAAFEKAVHFAWLRKGERGASAILGHSTSCNPCNRVRLCETCPIARSAQPFRPDGNHLPGITRSHCPVFLEKDDR